MVGYLAECHIRPTEKDGYLRTYKATYLPEYFETCFHNPTSAVFSPKTEPIMLGKIALEEAFALPRMKEQT